MKADYTYWLSLKETLSELIKKLRELLGHGKQNRIFLDHTLRESIRIASIALDLGLALVENRINAFHVALKTPDTKGE